METPLWVWGIFNLFILGLLAFDMGILNRNHREIKIKDAVTLSLFYFIIAVFFNIGLFYFAGTQKGVEFMTGYLIEKSLSIDNIFVFVLIFNFFQVPHRYQYRVLFWGIIGALAMRAVMIIAGAQLIHSFKWVIFIFAAFLIYTGIKMLLTINEKPDLQNNKIILFIKRRFRVTEVFHKEKFFVQLTGKIYMTPLFIVLCIIAVSDAVFALDSIPAIFAVTTDTFIVYTANIFAVLGLRALYFAIIDFIYRFYYLKYSLAFILILIGGKMAINEFTGVKVISTEAALIMTALMIIIAMLLSWMYPARAKGEPFSGWVPGSPPKRLRIPRRKKKN